MRITLHSEDFHDLVAEVVDDFDGDAAGLGFGEGAGGVAVERFPGFPVDFGFERRPEGFVRVVGAKEIGVPHEEALLVVVGVDEPTGDTVRAVTANLAGVGMEDVHPIDLDPELTVTRVEEVDVGFTEDDEEVAFTRVLEIVRHVEISVHAGFEDGNAPQPVEFGSVGFVIESAGDQHVETRLCGFTGGFREIGTRDGAKFGADEDGSALLDACLSVVDRRFGVGNPFDIRSFSADEIAGPGSDPGEGDAVRFARLLDARGLEVFQNHLHEVLLLPIANSVLRSRVDQFVVLTDVQDAVRGQTFHREWSGDPYRPLILVGLVVEVFVVGIGGDGVVDLFLPGDTLFPPIGV